MRRKLRHVQTLFFLDCLSNIDGMKVLNIL